MARRQSSTSPLVIMKLSRGKARLMGSPLDLEMTPRQTMPYAVRMRKKTSA